MSCLGLLPPLKEKRDFGFSTDQGREPSGLSHVKATGGTTLAEHLVYVHGLSDATQCLCPQVLTLEIALDQSIRHSTDDNRIRLRQPLDARTNVGNLAKCQVFIPPCSTHLPHNHQPR